MNHAQIEAMAAHHASTVHAALGDIDMMQDQETAPR